MSNKKCQNQLLESHKQKRKRSSKNGQSRFRVRCCSATSINHYPKMVPKGLLELSQKSQKAPWPGPGMPNPQGCLKGPARHPTSPKRSPTEPQKPHNGPCTQGTPLRHQGPPKRTMREFWEGQSMQPTSRQRPHQTRLRLPRPKPGGMRGTLE